MGEIAESQGVAAQCFQSAVDGFGRPVGGVVIEEGQDVCAAAPQGAAQLCQFLEHGRLRRSESMVAVIMVLPRRR